MTTISSGATVARFRPVRGSRTAFSVLLWTVDRARPSPNYSRRKTVFDSDTPARCERIPSRIAGSGVASRSTNPDSPASLSPLNLTWASLTWLLLGYHAGIEIPPVVAVVFSVDPVLTDFLGRSIAPFTFIGPLFKRTSRDAAPPAPVWFRWRNRNSDPSS